eukprot:TRINITY_DN65195_c0_g1_i1.p1 TRINITY_DN65195_c0_g1~~TRINITY_DN65195_c0_g1_i1.p1  ORF type:complete len:457 (+),score=99.05 TRINITY_DN65195_c0_g1_i1:90-1460(+)
MGMLWARSGALQAWLRPAHAPGLGADDAAQRAEPGSPGDRSATPSPRCVARGLFSVEVFCSGSERAAALPAEVRARIAPFLALSGAAPREARHPGCAAAAAAGGPSGSPRSQLTALTPLYCPPPAGRASPRRNSAASPSRAAPAAALDAGPVATGVATAASDGSICVWSEALRMEARAQVRGEQNCWVTCMCTTKGLLWCGLSDGGLRLYDPWRLAPMRMAIAHRCAVAALVPSPPRPGEDSQGGSVLSYPVTAAADGSLCPMPRRPPGAVAEERVCEWGSEGTLLRAIRCDGVWVDRRLQLCPAAPRSVLWDDTGDMLTAAPCGGLLHNPAEGCPLALLTVDRGVDIAGALERAEGFCASVEVALRPGESVVAAAAVQVPGVGDCVCRVTDRGRAIEICANSTGHPRVDRWLLRPPPLPDPPPPQAASRVSIVALAATHAGLVAALADGRLLLYG